MGHLQTDGAQVFSQWRNEGMTAYRKRPHDSAQLAKLTIDIASGNGREHAQPKKANRRKTRTKRPKKSLLHLNEL
jgi:hypothetical protein